MSTAKESTKIKKASAEEDAKRWDKEKIKELESNFVNSAKGVKVSRIEFYDAVYSMYAYGVHEFRGFATPELYVKEHYPQFKLSPRTIRSAIETYKKVMNEISAEGTEGEKAAKEAQKILHKINDASEGHSRYVEKIVNYGGVVDRLDEVLAIAKSTPNFLEIDALMAKRGFKLRDERRSKTSKDVAAKKKAASADGMVVYSFAIPAESDSWFKSRMEVVAREAGTTRPFTELSVVERGAVLRSWLTDWDSGNRPLSNLPDDLDERKALIQKEAQHHLETALRMLFPDEPSREVLLAVFKDTTASIRKHLSAADEEGVDDDGTVEEGDEFEA